MLTSLPSPDCQRHSFTYRCSEHLNRYTVPIFGNHSIAFAADNECSALAGERLDLMGWLVEGHDLTCRR